MKEEYCNIYNLCFPNLKMTYERFADLLKSEKCVEFEYAEDGEICAFAILEDFAIRLICVVPSKQGQGIGTGLLSDIEAYAKGAGYEKIITGGVSSRLFIGAPDTCWKFWEKKGFSSAGGCDEMLFKLSDFRLDELKLHGSEVAEYGWYEGDMEDIHKAVAAVDEGWVQYFTNPKNIYVARVDGEIASFCLIDTNCRNYLTDMYGKIGMPGCVGTVPHFRNKGIALEMVARATDYLKEQGMDISFIFFTGVAGWYEKIGYKIFLSEVFGVKELV